MAAIKTFLIFGGLALPWLGLLAALWLSGCGRPFRALMIAAFAALGGVLLLRLMTHGAQDIGATFFLSVGLVRSTWAFGVAIVGIALMSLIRFVLTQRQKRK